MGTKRKNLLKTQEVVGKKKKRKRGNNQTTCRNKWSGGRGESLGCNLFCSELGKEGESGYIYFIIFDGNEKKKFILNKVVGNWSLEVGREKKKQKQRTARKLLFEEMEENKKVVELGKQ